MSAPIEVLSVKAWNETLRDATVSGATVIGKLDQLPSVEHVA